VQTVKQYKYLVLLGQSYGNLPHLSRRGPTSFEHRFLEEFEKSFSVFVKTAFSSFESIPRLDRSTHMGGSPHLGPMIRLACDHQEESDVVSSIIVAVNRQSHRLIEP
jgi:hypothetical protein